MKDKYRVLLTGKNKIIMDDIFFHMDVSFECQSTSMRYDDVLSHLRHFEPDIFLYCLYSEEKDDVMRITSLRDKFRQAYIPLVIIGDQKDCDEFERITYNAADKILVRPITVNTVRDNIIKELYTWERKKAEDEEERALAIAAEATRAIEAAQAAETAEWAKEAEAILAAGEVMTAKEARESMVPKSTTKARKDSSEKPGAPEKTSSAAKAAGAARATADKAAAAGDRRGHILVVDDDPRMLKVIRGHVKDDYDVATAINGRLALKFLEKKSTDLILLDYEMPDMKGPEVFEAIRKNPELQDVPVVFLTGVGEMEKVKEVMSLKPQGYLLKPVEHGKLLETIQNQIG